MTDQQATMEQAIQTVIHDRRVPEKLRSALAVYQEERRDMSSGEIGMVRGEQTEPANSPKAIRADLAGACGAHGSQNATQKDPFTLSCECGLEREIHICLSHDDASLDWSIEINKQRHEHVTSEIMEALVECALIVAQMSLTRALVHGTQ